MKYVNVGLIWGVVGYDDLGNSHIWQSLSLRDWRWKAVVTLGWMGATFSGSGSWPPRGTAIATRADQWEYRWYGKFTWIAALYQHFIFFWKVFLAATKQLYQWFSPSVRLSVRPSVCPSVRPSVTPFWLCSHHPVIMKFSGVITSDKSDVHAKGQGQRSKVKVTEVTTQLNRFRTVTPV